MTGEPMDVCDAIEDADDNDKPVPAIFARKLAQFAEIESAMLALAEDLKYPVDHRGHVLDMNHLPDVPHCLAYHLVRRGWRPDREKALIKPRKVLGAGFYQDLVTYVPVDGSDEPVVVPRPEPTEPWSVKFAVNETFEERPK